MRSADLTIDSGARGLRLQRAGMLAFELGRADESLRLLTAATELVLPAHERAEARLYLEVLAGTWSGAKSVHGFALAAQELAETGDDREALTALEDVSVRAYWANLDDETRQARYAEQVRRYAEAWRVITGTSVAAEVVQARSD